MTSSVTSSLTHAPWRLFLHLRLFSLSPHFTCSLLQFGIPEQSFTIHRLADQMRRIILLYHRVIAYGLLINIGSYRPVTHGRFLEESTVISHHISTLTISKDFKKQELLVRHLVPSHGPVCDHQRILTLFPLLVSVMQHAGLLESLHGSPQNRS